MKNHPYKNCLFSTPNGTGNCNHNVMSQYCYRYINLQLLGVSNTHTYGRGRLLTHARAFISSGIQGWYTITHSAMVMFVCTTKWYPWHAFKGHRHSFSARYLVQLVVAPAEHGLLRGTSFPFWSLAPWKLPSVVPQSHQSRSARCNMIWNNRISKWILI